MAGEIVIFTKTGCPHCLHAKKTLRESDLEYKEILVNDDQNIRQFLKDLTDKSSIPQIFFNGDNIGGNDALQTVKLDNAKWQDLMDDLNENLTRRTFNFSSHSESTENFGFKCNADDKAEIIKELLSGRIFNHCRRTIFSREKIQKITPATFIEWYTSTKNTGESEAETVLKEIMSKKYLILVDNCADPKNAIESNHLLRLNDGSDSSALNAGTTNFCKLENSASLGKLLRKQLLQLYNEHLSQDGKKVDYEKMKESPNFTEFLGLSKELQLSPAEQFSEDEKKAFFINVYNAMVIHAIIMNGPPGGLWNSYKFYSTLKYIIAGYEFTLDDIESGILRVNKRSIFGIFRPFSSWDNRKSLMLKNLDPRIHFALNCGLKSCPPISAYSAENIDEELRSATQAYLENDDGVRITLQDDSAVVQLSSLFKWYASDFGKSPQEVLEWVKPFLSDDKKMQMDKALATKYKLSYIEYDTGSNSSS